MLMNRIENTLHGMNLLCCISSDLLKTSVLVSGRIISEIPVSIDLLACNSAILTKENLTEPEGLVLCLQTSKLSHKIAQLGNCFR